MDPKVSTKTKTFQNLNKNCPLVKKQAGPCRVNFFPNLLVYSGLLVVLSWIFEKIKDVKIKLCGFYFQEYEL